eukprot:COSAG02_NODE_5873_length_3972_cov_20.899045_9_plen_65_part_00
MPLVLPVRTQNRTRTRLPEDRPPVQAATRPESTPMWSDPVGRKLITQTCFRSPRDVAAALALQR